MKTIKLVKMTIENFKGIAKGAFAFDEKKTEITADVMQGKTSLKEAFLFALGISINGFFPCDKNNNLIDGLETKVDIVLSVDGIYYILSRSAKVKWKVDKDSGTKRFDGFKQDIFEFDGVPCGLSVYKEKLCQLFGIDNFNILQILTIPAFFNEEMSWKERRALIYSLFVDDSLLKKVKEKPEYSLIYNELAKGKSTADITTMLNSENNRILDEKRKNEILLCDKKSELATFDEATISADVSERLLAVEDEIKQEEQRLEEERKTSTRAKILEEIRSLEIEFIKLENKDREQEQAIYALESRLKHIHLQATEIEDQIEELSFKYKEEQERVFDDSAKVCPMCKQGLKQTDIDKLVQSWEEVHEATLTALKTKISALKLKLEEFKKEHECVSQKLSVLQDELSSQKESKEKSRLTEKIAELQSKLDSLTDGTQDLSRLNELRETRKKLLVAIGKKDYYLSLKANVERLYEEQRDIANREITLFKKRNQLEQYTLEIISLVNDSINENFDGVQFKLFEVLTATAKKDIKETLVCLHNGIDYENQSTGQKAMTNCVIVTTLQNKLGVNLPIWLDDASILNLEREPDNQLIYLLNEKGRTLDVVRIRDIY